jgi:hypothetical protein
VKLPERVERVEVGVVTLDGDCRPRQTYNADRQLLKWAVEECLKARKQGNKA